MTSVLDGGRPLTPYGFGRGHNSNVAHVLDEHGRPLCGMSRPVWRAVGYGWKWCTTCDARAREAGWERRAR